MSKLVCFFLFFIIFLFGCTRNNTTEFITSQINGFEAPEIDAPEIPNLNISKYVNAPAGLCVRSSPGLSSERIGSLDDLAKVFVVKEDEENVIIDGINGRWTFIKSDNIEGWVFGGFLSLEMPLRTANTINDIVNNIIEITGFGNRGSARSNARNLNDFLGFFYIFDNYEILSRVFHPVGPHWDPVYTYDITDGPYTIGLIVNPDHQRYIVTSFEIELGVDNFISLFPHRNMENFLSDNSFGEISNYGSDFITYAVDNGDLWALLFTNGIITGVSFSGIIP